MKKTIALFAITLLFLSVGVLADQNPLYSTNVQLDTMTRQSADSVCGPVSLAMVEKDKVRFRLNGNLYDVPRPEALKNKAAYTEIGDCAVQAGLVEPTKYGSSVVLAFIPISKNKLYFGGDILKLRVGEEEKVKDTIIKCEKALNDRLTLIINSEDYTSRFGATVKQGNLEITFMNRQGGYRELAYCVLKVKAVDSSLANTPATAAVQSPVGGLFKGITGKVISAKELARLEGKLTESPEDKKQDDARQLALDKVGGKFGGDVTGKVVYEVDGNKVTKVGKADPSNAKRLSAPKLLLPTIKNQATPASDISRQFDPKLISGKVVYEVDGNKVTKVERSVSSPSTTQNQNAVVTKNKQNAITNANYKTKTANEEETVISEKRQGTGITSESRFGGKITGKAVDETQPTVEKGFFAKLLSSLFGI